LKTLPITQAAKILWKGAPPAHLTRIQQKRTCLQIPAQSQKMFVDKFQAYVDNAIGNELHRQNVYQVRMNDVPGPGYPQIIERWSRKVVTRSFGSKKREMNFSVITGRKAAHKTAVPPQRIRPRCARFSRRGPRSRLAAYYGTRMESCLRRLRQAMKAITSAPTKVSPIVEGSGNCCAVPNSTPS
jgi:hypothetical protein